MTGTFANLTSSAELTMTSREIAELTGKRHDNVMADIRKMLVELYGEDRLLSFQGTVERPNPSGGTPITSVVYILPKYEASPVVLLVRSTGLVGLLCGATEALITAPIDSPGPGPGPGRGPGRCRCPGPGRQECPVTAAASP